MRAGEISREIRDGDWTLYEWSPELGRTTWVMFDGDKTHVRHDYEVSSLISQNTARRNATPDGWKGDWHHVASIPLNLVHDENVGLNKAFQQGDQKHISRWLNDGDNAAWRTKSGLV